MVLSRRQTLFGGAALGLVRPGPATAAAGVRELRLFRDGREIGAKTITVSRSGDRLTVATRISIAVTLLGLTLYRYTLAADETWTGGALQSLRSETDDNGTAHFARADRTGAALSVTGSRYEGPAPSDAATTSYWTPAFLSRPVWISSQDGRPLAVAPTDAGPAAFPTVGGTVEATRWSIGGELDGLFVFYDAAGEWVGTEFPASGETAQFRLSRRGPPLAPLWTDA